jgi:hypothetical protein
MPGKTKAQREIIAKEKLDHLLVGTVKIRVPKFMTLDKNGQLMRVNTLTKTHNITKKNKTPVIKLVASSKKNDIKIKKKGKSINSQKL